MEDQLEVVKKAIDGLAVTVDSRFQEAKEARSSRENVWVKSLRNFNGEVGPEFDTDKSEPIFINITQMKTMAAYVRTMALMDGPAGFPFTISPTPHPELIKSGLKMEAALEIPEVSQEMKEVLSIAKAASDGMNNKIKDVLAECHWRESFAKGALEFCAFGTMIFKGPVGAPPKPSVWSLEDVAEDSLGNKIRSTFGLAAKKVKKYQLKPKENSEYRAQVEWAPLFEVYIDPAASSATEAMYFIHRHVVNKARLMEMGVEAFDASAILTLVDESPTGDWIPETWESQVNDETANAASTSKSNRYVVLEFWGYISGKDLREAGQNVAEKDLNKMHLAEIWTCAGRTIKVNVSNRATGKLPFYVVPYEAIPYSIHGRGIPEKMMDPQDIINASARAMIENMGMCAGPQVIVDLSRLADGFSYTKITPWGVIPIRHMEGITTSPVQFVDVPSVIPDLERVMSIFRNFTQEVTSIPDMASGMVGQGEHNRTLGGMSMLFGAADAYTRGVVSNIDNYLTQPMIRALYDWEMQYCEDASIKGDMQIVAGGVQGLMAKELTSQRHAETLKALAQIPGGPDYIDMSKYLKQVFRDNDVTTEDFINTREQVAKIQQERQQAEIAAAGQKAEAVNVPPKAKAETTRNDMLLQTLGKTASEDPIYPIVYAKLLEGYGELDPQAEAALNMMKGKNVQLSKAFADARELEILEKDLELAGKINPMFPDEAIPEAPPEMPPEPSPTPSQPLSLKPKKYVFKPGEDGSMTAIVEGE